MREFIESNGDYRGEKALEANKPLYAHQDALPPLPVAPLQETCAKYLASVKALVSEAQYKQTEAVVAEFLRPGGVGERLHAQLQERAQRSHAEGTSWLAQWWNQLGYLQVRDPVVINVSYFFHFSDSPRPEDQHQIGRAATLVRSAMTFRQAWANGTLPPERMGKDKTPLCSVAYKYMFNACRVPARGQDTIRLYPPAQNHHIAVACRGQFYVVEVTDESGAPLSKPQLEKQLSGVAAMAPRDAAAPCVGVLTAGERDAWADARAQLVADGNEEGLREIESAAFVLCLDDEAPVTRDEVAAELWHGSGRNRWYDKSVQLIVFANGKAGLMGEHSMMDGMPVLRFADYLMRTTMAPRAAADADAAQSHPVFVAEPRPVGLAVSPAARRHIAVAEVAFDLLTGGHECRTLAYAGYGSDAIKGFGMSPDAYVQMALQLAYYRMTGTHRATYEPAQMRRFLHGRTACVRGVTTAAVDWVQAMTTGVREPTPRKLALLKAAAAAHVANAAAAAAGRDVDRLLFGLNMLAERESDRALFQDLSFAQTKHWAISTSHLTNEAFDNWGWGEVVPDGVGVAYMIKRRGVYANVASVRDAARRWPAHLTHLLHEALEEMRSLCEASAAAAAGSKL